MDMDTISAISTPMGEGAIGIVRISGPKAVELADRLYKGAVPLQEVASHTINYGHLINPEDGQIIEEVMVSVLRAPKTYTKEDMIEVNCHGGLTSVNRVLQLILNEGARLAEPGEFTKRAFLNGRIDLSQAEAVMDLIQAKTDRAMNVAMKQVEGKLSNRIQTLRQALLETVASVEVNIDYPEYDAEEVTLDLLREKSTYVKQEIDRLLTTAEQGKILREGLSTVIVGRPNVGKSSLLNSLVHENKAIVTEIPGTTRDVIEEYVNIRGVPLKLLDTAGIRETEDVVERLGVERSRQVMIDAELILFVVNYNEPLTDSDRELFELVKDQDTIVIVNKRDLDGQIDMKEVNQLAGQHPVVTTSLLKDEGVDELEEAIRDLFFEGDLDSGDLSYVSNSRHIALLNQAKRSIDEALMAVETGMPVDMVQIDITKAWELLGEVIGDSVHESLIDQLFSQFCLGK
ncbi:tRNA uridine-5-carboxymethylaminomethyl(34) synthesis GTPase MnmE [Salisediminibacterium selenitireducens]|uniref:tRNA modification GTPase MnmE n=1 Tax=Bacillus selenitireducens (strain ATCC 700615 / DSM 15326 / MLS10) TaxID=439292 RepID=D6Y1L6_BACIE|nr:tRNA uridine-5-carboxymethylaminomethyl(34) synthesis GTPase MnmE [Salisediminibacterium selenitireducens]ADI00803.1 tRNA modification GTPase TrmE [[Bacillus] selenitireducens MLS10]